MADTSKYAVELTAKTTQFQAELARASAAANAANQKISAAFSSMKFAATGLAATFGVSAVVTWTKDMVRAAAELQDLSEATGSSVEALSRLNNIARIGGTDFDKFKTALERLTAGMGDANEDSNKVGKALKALGVTATDPATALEEVAKKLDKFADGAGKAAIAKDLFGKAGVGLVSVLKDIVEYGDQAGTVSAKQAAEATRLADQFRKLQINSTAVGHAFLNDVVPALSTLVQDMAAATKIAGSLAGGLGLLANTFNPFLSVNEGIAKTRDELEKLKASRVDVGKLFGPDAKNLESNIKKLEKTLVLQKQMQVNAIGLLDDPSNYDARDFRARVKPKLEYDSTPDVKRPKDDPSQKILSGKLQALNAETEAIRDGLKFQEEYYQQFFAANLVGYKEFYAKRSDLQAEQLRVTVSGIDQEIDVLRKFQSEQSKTDTDREDKENQIRQLLAKRAAAEREAGQASSLGWFAANAAAKDYQRTLDELRARVLELSGNTVAAARIRQQAQNQDQRERLRANNDQRGLADLDYIERQVDLQVQLNEKENEFGAILASVGNAQSLVAIKREAGFLSEIEGLSKLSGVNVARIGELKQLADEYERLARAANDPKALAGVEAMRLKIEELAAAGDLVAKKFTDIFANAFGDALLDVIEGTKSLKDAFKSLEKSIVHSLNEIAINELKTQLFGKGGSGANIGDLISKLLGAFGGGSGGGLGYGTIGSAIPDGPFPYANGTNFARGGLSLVGERGPELVNLPRGAQVIPNNKLGGSSVTVTNHFSIQGPVSHASERQIAVAAGRAITQAMRRQ